MQPRPDSPHPLFWRRSTVSPVFFGRYPRSSLHSFVPFPPPLSPSLIIHLASVDVEQNGPGLHLSVRGEGGMACVLPRTTWVLRMQSWPLCCMSVSSFVVLYIHRNRKAYQGRGKVVGSCSSSSMSNSSKHSDR